MRRSCKLLLAMILVMSAPLAMARTTIVSTAQENCPGANAEAEAGDAGLDAGLATVEPVRKPASGKSQGKSQGNGLGKGNKSRWRALLPGAMR